MSTEHLYPKKNNKIIESSYKLTLIEQRIVLTGVTQINTTKDTTTNKYFNVSVIDIADSSNLENINYTHLKQAVQRLYNRSIVIENYDNGVCTSTSHMRWFSDITYTKEDCGIRLEFANKIVPRLPEIQKYLTQYKHIEVAGMKSIYSIRLYELLVPWLEKGEKLTNVEWLKEQLQVSDKYPRFTSLRGRVLDVAVNEINKRTSLVVNYTTRKTGKFITHILFTLSGEAQQASVAVDKFSRQLMIDNAIRETEKRLQGEKKQSLQKFNELDANNRGRLLQYFAEYIAEDSALSISYRNEGLDNASVIKAFINYLGSK